MDTVGRLIISAAVVATITAYTTASSFAVVPAVAARQGV